MQIHDLSFLQEKINQIGTAIFYAESKNLLPFQAYVITVTKTDNEGYIWFSINRSWKQAASQDESFPADLEFYRKGYPYSLKVKGQAILDSKPFSDSLLIKLKIERSDYKELIPPVPFNPVATVKSFIRKVISTAGHQLQPSV